MDQAPPPSTLVIGVLGGIASGKSRVARLLAGSSGVVIDADAIAREVLDSEPVRREVAQAFGADLLDADGRIDRSQLAARVFASPAERKRLEAFTHPRIRDRMRSQLEEARAARVPRVVLDVPLLLENEARHGLVAECHELVFVDAALADRERRASVERGWPRGELARREAAQLPLESKRLRANHVIDNSQSPAELEQQIAQLARQLDLRWKR